MKIRAQTPAWRRGVRTLARIVFRRIENNDEQRIERNGELWLLRSLLRAHAAASTGRPFVLVDAGANTGEYSILALREARTLSCAIEIHAFEPSLRNLELLRATFAKEPAVKIVGAALSEHGGEGSLYAGSTGSGHASLLPRSVLGSQLKDEARVPLVTLFDYAIAQNLPRIDLLKLDIEGAELSALQGLGDKLHPDFIDVIQFEYGGTTLDAGATLREFHRMLVSCGFEFAKLFPDAVEIRPYRDWMESYAFANYVAIAPRWVGPKERRHSPR